MSLSAVYIFPGYPVMLEALLIGLLIALIGAAGYTFFSFSMHADRNAEMRKHYYDNPWDTVSGQNNHDEPQKPLRSKGEIVRLILLLTAIAVVIFLLFLVTK